LNFENKAHPNEWALIDEDLIQIKLSIILNQCCLDKRIYIIRPLPISLSQGEGLGLQLFFDIFFM